MLSIPEIYSSSICLIEWPQRLAEEFYPSVYLSVTVSIHPGDERRVVAMESRGQRWDERLRTFKKEFVSFTDTGTCRLSIN